MTEEQTEVWAGVLLTVLLVGVWLGGLLILWLTGNWGPRRVADARSPLTAAATGVPPGGPGPGGPRWS